MYSILKKFDLNLLLSLHALLTEQQVSLAAERLDITQSGMSKNLSRLRELLDDPLLVRKGNQMILTPRAEAMVTSLQSIVDQVDQLVMGDDFDPRQRDMSFRVAASDFLVQLYAPSWLNRIQTEAPHTKIVYVPWSTSTFSGLQSGEVDFAFGVVDSAPAGIYRKVIQRSSRYVCIGRRGHPALSGSLSLEHYVALRHVVPQLTGGGTNPVDLRLNVLGLTREIAVETPFFMAAVAIVSQTDLVMIVNESMVERLQPLYPLTVANLPFDLEFPPFGLFWHERVKASAPHLWFREQFLPVE
ncbi:LysR family transcriptional regulator [Oleiphilus messinensis]|uniref:LysR family transcriptional regulator n=1 Tax=Oleiphilus messinensis TaxID=141451 RepID=A0A1Y0ICQ1_9GAMM|nr:LysR family transcriptional regulator [Oleiphilus messinensis]ARU58030.1 LysR family transcriptional regulator [Oleiphilus messinensis]